MDIVWGEHSGYYVGGRVSTANLIWPIQPSVIDPQEGN